uniref:poly(A)-specific ribonuclease n=1 Tax=Strongyloides venezuelensis TaxID=75913 RepID=A0A0K0F6P7_STRVS
MTALSRHVGNESKEIQIIDVWKDNLREVFSIIHKLVEMYPFVSVDSEFPGVVATPMGYFKNRKDFNFKRIICNVELLKVIQIGFTFFNAEGDLPPGNPVFQFNFEFNMYADYYSPKSIELLQKSGIDFNKHQKDGISMEEFGELLTTSGLLANPKVIWLAFSSGFDFCYIIKSILCRHPPLDEMKFSHLINTLFPSSVDLKILLKEPEPSSVKLQGGLQDVALMLQVERVGLQHTAGSDALLTGKTFFSIKKKFFPGKWMKVIDKIRGQLDGLTVEDKRSEPYSKYPKLDCITTLELCGVNCYL